MLATAVLTAALTACPAQTVITVTPSRLTGLWWAPVTDDFVWVIGDPASLAQSGVTGTPIGRLCYQTTAPPAGAVRLQALPFNLTLSRLRVDWP